MHRMTRPNDTDLTAEDAMTTLVLAIVAGNTPLCSHQLIGSRRTGVPRSRPLAHPVRIGARKRVRRSLNERIHSAYVQSPLPIV